MEGDDAVRLYEVAIIGAGFDGLSAATYLKAAGMQMRVFGQLMAFLAAPHACWHVSSVQLGRLPYRGSRPLN